MRSVIKNKKPTMKAGFFKIMPIVLVTIEQFRKNVTLLIVILQDESPGVLI